MNFYPVLVHLHSILRWLLLVLVIISIILAARGIAVNTKTNQTRLRPALWSMMTAHIQLILGLIVYFLSPKVIFSGASMKEPILRFFLVEHILVMLIAIILITIGYIRAKKAANLKTMNRTILVFFIIALILMLSRIPWPFMGYGGGWM